MIKIALFFLALGIFNPIYAEESIDLYSRTRRICDFPNNVKVDEYYDTGLMTKSDSGEVFFFIPWRERRPALLKSLREKPLAKFEDYLAGLGKARFLLSIVPSVRLTQAVIESIGVTIKADESLSSCVSMNMGAHFSAQEEDNKDPIYLVKNVAYVVQGEQLAFKPNQSLANHPMYKRYKDLPSGVYFSYGALMYRLYTSGGHPDIYHLREFYPGDGANYFEGSFLNWDEINRIWNNLSPRVQNALTGITIIPKSETAEEVEPVKKKPPERRKPAAKKPPPARNDDLIANYHAYPAELVGASMQASGASDIYTMKLDPTDGSKEPTGKLPTEKDAIDYKWAVYNITNLVKKGELPKEDIAKWMEANPIADEEEITKWAGQWRDLARRLGDISEDTLGTRTPIQTYFDEVKVRISDPRLQGEIQANGQTLLNQMNDPSMEVAMSGAIEMDMFLEKAESRLPKPLQAVTLSLKKVMPIKFVHNLLTKAKKIGALYINKTFLPITAIVALGGSAVSAVGRAVSDYPGEREIPWNKEGFFLVRCIATPKAKDGKKRASSVAIKIVEVRHTGYLALNTLNKTYAQLDELNLSYMIESDPQKKEALGQLIEKILKELRSDAIGFLTSIINNKRQEKASAVGSRASELDKEIHKLELQQRLAIDRYNKYANKGNKETRRLYVRPEGAFSSEITSASYPLTLQLFEQEPKDGFIHWVLSDVSTADGKVYEGHGRNNAQAIWNATYNFSSDNDYGRGTIAIRLPDKKLLPDIDRRSGMLRSTPRGTALIKQHLNDLAIVLTAASLFVPGLGEVALFVTSALAAERMITRFSQNTLRLDAAMVGDLVAVIGSAGAGVGTLGRLRLAKTEKLFFVAKEGGDVSKLTKLASGLENAAAFFKNATLANDVINAGGLILGNLELALGLAEITKDELEGKITHTDARRKIVALVIEAIPNNAFYIHGMMQNAKQHQSFEPSARREPPPLEHKELDFRAGITERLAEPERFKRLSEPLGQDFALEHPDATSTKKIFEILEVEGAVLGKDVERLEATRQLEKDGPWIQESLSSIKLENTTGISTSKEGDSLIHKVEIRHPSGQTPTSQLQFSIESVERFTQQGTHGEDSGHARYSLDRKDGTWKAKIYIHQNVKTGSVKHVLGHELYEITKIIEKFPNADQSTIAKQTEAGVFKRGGSLGEITCHDEASAWQLFNYYKAMSEASVSRTKKRSELAQMIEQKSRLTGDDSDPQKMAITKEIDRVKAEVKALNDSLDNEHIPRTKRLLKAMGIHEEPVMSARKDRLDLLMDMLYGQLNKERPSSGVGTPEMDNWVELETIIKQRTSDLRIWTEIQSYKVRTESQIPGESTEQIDTIRHLLYPKLEKSAFSNRGLRGGHIESELVQYQKSNPSVYVKEVDSWKIGETTIKKFEQYLYKNSEKVPSVDELPGGSQFKPEDWQRAEIINEAGVKQAVVKTTVDKLSFLLDRGIPAFEKWTKTENAKKLATEKPAEGRSHNTVGTGPIVNAYGEMFEAYATYKPNNDGSGHWVLETIYPVKPVSVPQGLLRKDFLFQPIRPLSPQSPAVTTYMWPIQTPHTPSRALLYSGLYLKQRSLSVH